MYMLYAPSAQQQHHLVRALATCPAFNGTRVHVSLHLRAIEMRA